MRFLLQNEKSKKEKTHWDLKYPLFKKNFSIMAEADLNDKETEFDWKDRLKAWKKVQNSQGLITDFNQINIEHFESSSV